MLTTSMPKAIINFSFQVGKDILDFLCSFFFLIKRRREGKMRLCPCAEGNKIQYV